MQIEYQDNYNLNTQNHHQTTENNQVTLQDLALQTRSEQNDHLYVSNQKSDQSQKGASSQNSTDTDNFVGCLSLKSIKSKEEIQIESKQNQEILLNLNSNIDDLFKKISSLTEEITTDFQPRQLKQKQTTKIEFSPNKDQSSNVYEWQKIKSSPQLEFKFPNVLTENKSEYKPIFFELPKFTPKQYSISMKLFQIGKSLGYGKFGQVMQCRYFCNQTRNTKSGSLYALKKIFKSVIDEYNMEEQLLTELRILKQIDHPNIVKAYQAFTDDFHIFILMEYIHGPLLVNKLKCSQKECKVIVRQVLEALKYLHENKITHRDIKPQNIILTADNVVKICDFGWAAQGNEEMNILCGTLDYVSPQMVNEEPYTQKSDLWNLGVLTYELIHGYPPFKSSCKSRIFQRVKSLEYFFSDQIQISQQCKSFIAGFLKKQSERQSIEWGLNHQFLKPQGQEVQLSDEVSKTQDENEESLQEINSNQLNADLQLEQEMIRLLSE